MMSQETTTDCALVLLLNAVLHDARHSEAQEILLQPEAKQMRVLYRVGGELQEQLRLRQFVTPLLAQHLQRLCAETETKAIAEHEAFLVRWNHGNRALHVSYAVA